MSRINDIEQARRKSAGLPLLLHQEFRALRVSAREIAGLSSQMTVRVRYEPSDDATHVVAINHAVPAAPPMVLRFEAGTGRFLGLDENWYLVSPHLDERPAGAAPAPRTEDVAWR